jgi:hypothetical protein
MRVLFLLPCLMLVSQSTFAFTVVPRSTTLLPHQSRTTLNLFGGGNKDKSGVAGSSGPGMMDQLAMFKKAQEIATKKRKLDEDLQKLSFVGTSKDGINVKVTMKYVPVTNPLDPNPEYESIKFDFEDEYYNSVNVDDLAKDIQDAILNGIESTNKMVAEKYSTLQSDLMEALGGKLPGLK